MSVILCKANGTWSVNIYGVCSYRDYRQSSSSWGSLSGKGSHLVSVYFLVFFRPFDFPLVPGAKEEGSISVILPASSVA